MRLKPGFLALCYRLCSAVLFSSTLLAILFSSALTAPAWAAAAQTTPGVPRPTQGLGQRPPRDQDADQEDQQREHMEKDMAKKANQERQAQLKRDTDKLFQLATDLKDEVDKSNENVLALNVIKKADEIERLAHSVKEKMKGQ